MGDEDGTQFRVCVRNTFLKVEEDDDTPSMPGLDRASTEPGRAPPQGGSPARPGVEPVVEEEEEEEELEELDMPPPMPGLVRWVTQDAFENLTDWQYVGATPQMPAITPSPPMTPPVASTPPLEFFGYAPQGFIQVPIVPVQHVPQQYMQLAQPVPMRGMPWPMDQMGQPVVPFEIGVQALAMPLDQQPVDQMRTAMAGPATRVEALGVPAMPGLERQFSTASQLHRLHWTVPEKKLRASDKQAVSPPFEIFGATWKLMLQASVSHSHKGGASFKSAKGWASLKLKCESKPDDTPSLTLMYRFFVGSSAPRGPGTHDFLKTPIAQLSQNEFWDLLSEVKTGTVTLGAEVWQL